MLTINNRAMVDRICDNVQNGINASCLRKTWDDFKEESKEAIYEGVSGQKYMTLDDSVRVLRLVLQEIAENCEHDVIHNHIKPWFDRRNGKKNTLLWLGPPDCLKTWTGSGLRSIAGPTGEMYNVNPKFGSRFALMGLLNSRLGFWDEAKFTMDAGFQDNLKKLLGGQIISTDVKCKDPENIQPTPMLVMANQHPVQDLSNWEAFNARMVTADFSGCLQFNKQVYGACHPNAWFVLDDEPCFCAHKINITDPNHPWF